jgi:hypothetical protein
VPHESLGGNWLFPCLFASARLNALTYEWIVRPPFETVTLGTLLAGVGPDIAQVKRAFSRADSPTAYPILWGHQAAMNTLALDERFVGHGAARPNGPGDALHRAHASALLLAERPHLHTEALLSVHVAVPVLSTAFWELKPATPDLATLLHLWFQSTFGCVSYLAHATSSRGDIFKLKKGQLAQVPVVRPSRVSAAAAQRTYDVVRGTPWRRFPDEFARAASGEGPRKVIDDFFIAQLGLRVDLRPIYELLAADPVVTTRRAERRPG